MPRLDLTDREQWALRDLLAAEPCPGSPLPTREVLELLTVLIPADEVCAVYQDGTYTVTQGIFLGIPGDEEPDLPDPGDGPHYLGIMHWSRHPLAAQRCLGGLTGQQDGLAIGFRNGPDGIVQSLSSGRVSPASERAPADRYSHFGECVAGAPGRAPLRG